MSSRLRIIVLLAALLTACAALYSWGGAALEDDETAHRFPAAVRRNAERMRDLINDILELSAIKAGTLPVEPREVRLSPLVAECFASLAPRAFIVLTEVPR